MGCSAFMLDDVKPVVLSVPTVPSDTPGVVSVLKPQFDFGRVNRYLHYEWRRHHLAALLSSGHRAALLAAVRMETYTGDNTPSVLSVATGAAVPQSLAKVLNGQRLPWTNNAVLFMRPVG